MASENESVETEDSMVVLLNCRFRCTRCQKWKGAAQFGLRTMDNGVVRNQAQCSKCRSV